MKKIIAWCSFVIAAVLAFLHFSKRDKITVTTDRIDAPAEQDTSGTLTKQEIESILKEVRGTR